MNDKRLHYSVPFPRKTFPARNLLFSDVLDEEKNETLFWFATLLDLLLSTIVVPCGAS